MAEQFLLEDLFDFPCARPVLDARFEPRLRALARDALFEAAVGAAEYQILSTRHQHKKVERNGVTHSRRRRIGQKSFDPSPTYTICSNSPPPRVRSRKAESSSPLHMFGLHPTLHPCCGPSGSTRRRRCRSPSGVHEAGLVIVSVKRSERPLACNRREK